MTEERPSLNELVHGASESKISSVRTVLAKIIEVINSPSSSAMDLKALIEMDPPLAGRVLKLANSALYGRHHPLVQILDAIITIGFESVRELALSQKVCEIFSKGEKFFGYTRTAVWMHSVAVALCGKMMYRKEFRRPGDDIYTVGLLHDIGIIVEDQFAHASFVRLLEDMQKEKGDLCAMEQRHLGYTHQTVGQALMQAWDMPPLLAGMIGIAENPEQAGADDARMACTLFVANHACRARRIGFIETHSNQGPLYQQCLDQLGVGALAMQMIMDEVSNTIQQMAQEGWF